MKGVSFSNMKTFYAGNVTQASKGQEMANGESFMSVFDKTQGTTDDMEMQKNSAKTTDTVETDDIQKHADIQKKATTEQVKETEGKGNVSDSVEEAANKMKEKVAEVLDISVEEVEAVLETLGLSIMDLLNPEVLTQVVMELNPGVDALALMTNEEMFADLKSLMNYADELKNQLCGQFQMSEEELKTLCDSMKELKTLQLQQEELTAMVEDGVVAEEPVLEEESTLSKKGADFLEKAVAEKANAEKQAAMEPVPVEVTGRKQETSSHGEHGDENGQNMLKEFYNRLSEAVEEVNTSNSSYGTTGGQEIIRQITEYIKVHVKPETTEMEMQLHPATLGSLKVQLASTGGVLTAIFTTENETVKSVLETQLIQLKENFTQQGLKVESIEVNVSAQGFERSLDQQESKQNSFEEAKAKKGNRRIRLNGLGEADGVSLEDVAEEDKVVADMMIRNGNSVDYSV